MAFTQAIRILRRLGWVYVAYHALISVLVVVLSIRGIDPGYWRTANFQLDMALVILVYPAMIPAFVVCGGLHDSCTTVLGNAIQIAALGGGVVCYLAGWWVVASFVLRSLRSSPSGRHV